jgi:CrcB protein
MLAMDTVIKLASVAIGGSVGAVARYLINISPIANALGKFPFGTFLINVAGSFLIGFLMIAFADRFQTGENLRLLVIVGFLGAFTTFSAFEGEIYTLINERQLTIAFAYLFLSIFLGFVGVAAGVELGRRI